MARVRPDRGGDAARLPASGDDQSLFDQAIAASDEARFAEAEAEEPGEGEPPPEPEREIRHVPLAELLDERDRRKQVEQRLQAYEQQELQRQAVAQPQPDYITQPNEFFDQRLQERLNPILQPILQHVAHTNRALAVATHGQEAVDAAQRSFDEEWAGGRMDRVENFRVMSQPNPFLAAVEWHQNRNMQKETGGDLTAYRQRLAEELLQNPEFLSRAVEAARGHGVPRSVTVAPRVAGRAAPQGRPNGGNFRTDLPPSLNRQGPPGGQPPALLDVADDDLYSEMTNPNKFTE